MEFIYDFPSEAELARIFSAVAEVSDTALFQYRNGALTFHCLDPTNSVVVDGRIDGGTLVKGGSAGYVFGLKLSDVTKLLSVTGAKRSVRIIVSEKDGTIKIHREGSKFSFRHLELDMEQLSIKMERTTCIEISASEAKKTTHDLAEISDVIRLRVENDCAVFEVEKGMGSDQRIGLARVAIKTTKIVGEPPASLIKARFWKMASKPLGNNLSIYTDPNMPGVSCIERNFGHVATMLYYIAHANEEEVSG